MCVGLIGAGYTGSYIFSQTVFTMRAGVHNRLCGLVVAVIEVIVFALPFSVVEVRGVIFSAYQGGGLQPCHCRRAAAQCS